MTDFKNKRLISGNRVICRCSLELPKIDPFDNFKLHRAGYMVFNTRGGSLYMPQQFTEMSITKLFKPNEASKLKKLTFQPEVGAQVVVGDMQARFLKFTNSAGHSGMVLRFVNLAERQLDILNTLVDSLPGIGDDEEGAIQKVMQTGPVDCG